MVIKIELTKKQIKQIESMLECSEEAFDDTGKKDAILGCVFRAVGETRAWINIGYVVNEKAVKIDKILNKKILRVML